MTRAFIFPGQGSQYSGMGKALYETCPEARQVFNTVDDALGQKLSGIIFDGPDDSLGLTENTQPALMSVSMALLAVLKARSGLDIATQCKFVAGHSLGEYTALTAAGALGLADAAKLLRIRGRAMQDAVPVGIGAMAAILGLSFEDVQAVTAEIAKTGSGIICEIANDNSIGQIVISGHKQAVEAAIILAAAKGAKRGILLPVSAPFHCSLMKPATQKMTEALEMTAIQKPCVPVVANVTAQAVTEPEEIKRLLIAQVTGMVRWRESVLWMKAQGIRSMTEIGAGKVLCGLIRRIDKDVECNNIETADDCNAFPLAAE